MSSENRLLRAVNQAASKLASADDADTVLREVLAICVEAVGAMGGTIYLHEPATKSLRFRFVLPEEVADRLERIDIPDSFGVAGEVFRSRKSKISDFPNATERYRSDIERKAGVTVYNMLTLPLTVTGMDPIGVIQLVNKVEGNFTETDVEVADTVSDICALSVMNSRMLTRQRHVAALEGMGRMAHDLANKAGVLVAFLPEFERNIEGLERALKEAGVEGDALLYLQMLRGTYDDVFAPYSDRVYRYARLVNNLAAGKPLEPKYRAHDFGSIVREAAEFMEPMAREARVKIEYDISADGPIADYDDLYVMRIVENLVGNAVKAVGDMVPPEWPGQHRDRDETFGSVTVAVSYAKSNAILQVKDTGAGMSPQRAREILAGTARSGWSTKSGSGLGTKVVLELVTALGGTVSIDSMLEKGTTFTVRFPLLNARPRNDRDGLAALGVS
ncbi:MAG: GAF domain-containing sensor histidine kinase [Fimbriimonadaceae bacterium]|nr:GAF domain-containing sensor histidine kinase [Fimbriimonadaceae bacterium]